MAIVRESIGTVAAAAATWANATTRSWSKPAGVAVGDLMVMILCCSSETTGTGPTAPSGWLDAQTFFNPGGLTASIQAWYKVAVTADVTATTYAWTNSTGATITIAGAGAITRYSGVDTTTPLDATSTTATVSNSATNSCPSITTVTADTKLIGVVATSSAVTWTSSVWSQLYEATGTDLRKSTVGDLDQVATGASGTKAWTASGKIAAQMVTIALRPATGPGSNPLAGTVTTASAVTADVSNVSPARAGGAVRRPLQAPAMPRTGAFV